MKYIGSRAELMQLMIWLLESDPYEIVKAGLDSFDAYVYVDKSPEMRELYSKQPSECQEEYDDFEDEYLESLRNGGGICVDGENYITTEEAIKLLKKERDDLINFTILK